MMKYFSQDFFNLEIECFSQKWSPHHHLRVWIRNECCDCGLFSKWPPWLSPWLMWRGIGLIVPMLHPAYNGRERGGGIELWALTPIEPNVWTAASSSSSSDFSSPPDFSFLWLPLLQYLSILDPPHPFIKSRKVGFSSSFSVCPSQTNLTWDQQCPAAKDQWIYNTQLATHLIREEASGR